MQYQSAAKETGNFKTDPRTTDATDSPTTTTDLTQSTKNEEIIKIYQTSKIFWIFFFKFVFEFIEFWISAAPTHCRLYI